MTADSSNPEGSTEQAEHKKKRRAPSISTRELVKILKSYGAVELPGRGKGSHAMFERYVNGKRTCSPVPLDRDVPRGTVRSIRNKLQLLPEHGVPDDEFFSRA